MLQTRRLSGRHTYINHREHRIPDDDSLLETLGWLGYHDDQERSANNDVEDTTAVIHPHTLQVNPQI